MYRNKIGSLMYLAMWWRPVLGVVASMLDVYLSKSTTAHHEGTKMRSVMWGVVKKKGCFWRRMKVIKLALLSTLVWLMKSRKKGVVDQTCRFYMENRFGKRQQAWKIFILNSTEAEYIALLGATEIVSRVCNMPQKLRIKQELTRMFQENVVCF